MEGEGQSSESVRMGDRRGPFVHIFPIQMMGVNSYGKATDAEG